MNAHHAVPTLGVEEEFLLVHPDTGRQIARGEQVAEYAKDAFGVGLDTELSAAQVETNTAVCHDLDEVREQLGALRSVAAESARRADARLLAVGAPPLGGLRSEVSDDPRYQRLHEDYRMLAEEQSICGCHVHVAVPDPEIAVQVGNHLRQWLPVLSLLTANSRYAQGRDTGYASWRSVVWSRWPSAGPPPYFESLEHYERTTTMLTESGAARDERMVYWDVRPSSRLPTVEVRVSDVAATVDEAVLLAALTRALVTTALGDLHRGVRAAPVPVEWLRTATWRAARDGLAGQALDVCSGRLVPARLLVDRLCDRVHDALRASGDLALVERLLTALKDDGTGSERQHRTFLDTGDPAGVVHELATRTLTGCDQGTPAVPEALREKP
ncbi:glutamate--cysteine ligase [Actinosynnema sp. NPDC047251]|uniref:Putative glutamate--cysteine ligase 2 n=1 Tax=Saccharothrix espanaensis (strain ATCC 51144 / DSM 44229 / JCM 9112 / NBRC 15066 / NRRL 15764) TaxID=1179773 RepID=K0K3W1_SACES|nr:glutamate--cysteine ligase [Saccharothrix espanaensis]CCH32277.1 Carboxylate-amine ligase [Saccharothrix espanaensis DSM 44229]